MITVEQLMHLKKELGLEVVVHGDMSQSVAWVVTSEVQDPTPYLNGGEVLLSTGIMGTAADHSWDRYIRRLSDRGVVAFGLTLGDQFSWQSVPEALVAAVRGTGLTLFTVPEETPFLGIIKAVADLRALEDRAALEVSLSHQRALTKAAMAVDGSAQVLKTLTALLPGTWAAVYSPDVEIRESSAPMVPALPSDRSLEEIVGGLRGSGLRGALSDSGPSGGVVVHPLGVHQDPHSYLVVVLPGSVERAHAGTITTAVALLSLQAERVEEQRLARRRIRAGAVALFLTGEVKAGDALLTVAGDDSWQGEVREVRAVRLRGEPGRTREALRRIEAYSDRAGTRVLVGAPALVSNGEEETVVLVEDIPSAVTALRRVVELTNVRAGIGGRAHLDDAAASNREAFETLERMAAPKRIGTWDDITAGGAASLLPAEPARAWSRGLLEPLSSQGAAGERLLLTLRVFLAHNGNRRQTAEALGIHRNTLLNQLQLVETAFQRSLDEPQLRADLWIALHLPNENSQEGR